MHSSLARAMSAAREENEDEEALLLDCVPVRLVFAGYRMVGSPKHGNSDRSALDAPPAVPTAVALLLLPELLRFCGDAFPEEEEEDEEEEAAFKSLDAFRSHRHAALGLTQSLEGLSAPAAATAATSVLLA